MAKKRTAKAATAKRSSSTKTKPKSDKQPQAEQEQQTPAADHLNAILPGRLLRWIEYAPGENAPIATADTTADLSIPELQRRAKEGDSTAQKLLQQHAENATAAISGMRAGILQQSQQLEQLGYPAVGLDAAGWEHIARIVGVDWEQVSLRELAAESRAYFDRLRLQEHAKRAVAAATELRSINLQAIIEDTRLASRCLKYLGGLSVDFSSADDVPAFALEQIEKYQSYPNSFREHAQRQKEQHGDSPFYFSVDEYYEMQFDAAWDDLQISLNRLRSQLNQGNVQMLDCSAEVRYVLAGLWNWLQEADCDKPQFLPGKKRQELTIATVVFADRGEDYADDIRRYVQLTTATAPQEQPPADKSSGSEEQTDGPVPPDAFYYSGTKYEGLTGTAWRLVDYLWTCRNMTAEFEDLAEPVWQEHDYPITPDAVGSQRRAANSFFAAHKLPYEVSTQQRKYVQLKKI